MNLPNTPIAGCMRWGKWGANFSVKEYLSMIESSVNLGITCFDHADIYGDYTTEKEFGDALKISPSLAKEIQIITKCGIKLVTSNKPDHQIKSYDTSKKHIIQSAETSLQNFNREYIDVFLIHRPDPLLNPSEVAEAINQLIAQGKILYFGVSNFLPHQINILKKYIDIEYNQIEISLLNTKTFTNGILDHCIEHGIIPMAWAPLGGGIFSDDTHPRFRRIITVATHLSNKYRTGINEILIAFLLSHPSGILPVLGTTKIERLQQVKNAYEINLEREDWFKLYEASTGEEVP